MKRNPCLFRINGRGWVLGLSWLGRYAARPGFDGWREATGGHYWFAHALGLSLWFDSTRPATVSERGAW